MVWLFLVAAYLLGIVCFSAGARIFEWDGESRWVICTFWPVAAPIIFVICVCLLVGNWADTLGGYLVKRFKSAQKNSNNSKNGKVENATDPSA